MFSNRRDRCRVDGVTVVVKAYIKRDPLEDLAPVEACLSRMAKALDTRSCPNVLPYQRWLQSNVSSMALQGVGKGVGPTGRNHSPSAASWPCTTAARGIDYNRSVSSMRTQTTRCTSPYRSMQAKICRLRTVALERFRIGGHPGGAFSRRDCRDCAKSVCMSGSPRLYLSV